MNYLEIWNLTHARWSLMTSFSHFSVTIDSVRFSISRYPIYTYSMVCTLFYSCFWLLVMNVAVGSCNIYLFNVKITFTYELLNNDFILISFEYFRNQSFIMIFEKYDLLIFNQKILCLLYQNKITKYY